MEWNRELVTQIDYLNRVSTEDYVAALFTLVIRGKKMVEWVKRPVGDLGSAHGHGVRHRPAKREYRPTSPWKQRTSKPNSTILL